MVLEIWLPPNGTLLSLYLSLYVTTLNITVSIYWCWQGKFPEYTHFVETSSTGCRDMLGNYGGKLCHRERGRCLARHQMYQLQNRKGRCRAAPLAEVTGWALIELKMSCRVAF